MNSNQISKAVRLALVAGAVSAVAAPAAFAADDQSTTTTTTTTTNNQSSTNLGKIEVTGTRIKRTDVETAQPVTILTQTQLKQTGLTSIGDILQTVSQAGSALNTTFNNGGNGSTNIDLRNLGANRVLVLVNGRRWTPALNGTVDLNTIPVSIIDHVEILQDGASSIYGSDAISGVVNIITVKNYNGAEATAYQSIYNGDSHWDGKTNEYDFTIGSSGDKAGVVMNVGYVNQHEIWAGNREISKEPIRGIGSAGGSSATPFGRFITVPTASGACPPGVVPGSYGSCDMTLKTGGHGGVVGSATGPSLNNFRNFTGPDHYNFAPLNYFITPNERTSFYAQGHYDLADNLTFTTDVLFNRRNSNQSLASSPLFLGLAGSSFVNGQPIGIGATNPYNPFKKTLNGNVSTWVSSTQDLLILYALRPVDSGRRVFNQNVETSQFTGTFKGYFNLGGNEWDWDLGYTYGDNYETDVTTGLFNTERLATALDSPGVAPCSSQPGCVPFNAFGGANGTLTPAMLNYVLFEEHDVSDREMRDFTGNINGSLFDMPAGPLGMALGYEYLEFDGFQHPDATVSSGNTSGNVTQPTDGREKTAAEYVEFDIPLVADAPGFKMLDLDIADRWSQFKWFGGIPGTTVSTIEHKANASTARAALKWQPNDSLLVRASWSQGFRVPSLSELFFGNSDSFPAATDPCAKKPGGWDGKAANYPAACPHKVVGGKSVPDPRIQPNGQIRTTVGGNPALAPEKAVSKTIGFVWNPDFIPGFDFSLDYYHIELDKQVTSIPVETIIQACEDPATSSSPYCSLITVKGTGSNKSITNVIDTNVNIGGIITSGIDLATHYKFPSTSAGDFKLGLDWTFLREFKRTLPDVCTALDAAAQNIEGCTSPADVGNGIFVSSDLGGSTTSFGGFPKQRANMSLAWNYGDFSATWGMEYIYSMQESCTPAMIGGGFCSDPTNKQNYLGKTIYHDVQGTYHADGINTDFTLGIRNLFDKQPPTADTAFANSFLPAFYRVPGREFYGRISVKF